LFVAVYAARLEPRFRTRAWAESRRGVRSWQEA
jgi:hypothetical protein